MSKREEQLNRLANVNEFITIIASMGRRFFNYTPESGLDRCAWMYLDNHGHVYFVDAYSEKRIYTHYSGRWKGFTSGGTLKSLVELFRDHIKRDAKLNRRYFDINSPFPCPWGYPPECYPKLCRAAYRLGIIEPLT
ncbi:hypothetical protein SAMN04487867_104102 [Vreelandella titanicae]|uniref:hypothetical protein n=1 Tax=Vreelandella titanicae TaxID=664683 RepID=UPI00087E4C55|nr:hypothetical protein [Halomonas titanicae]SDI28656.1 hypothetical protein SAMN04487867_104102 [Halomonas titanicae]